MSPRAYQSGSVHSAPSCLLRRHHARKYFSSKHRAVVSCPICRYIRDMRKLIILHSKTRHMADLCSELVKSWKIHQSLGSKLQGIHLEMTGDIDENGYRSAASLLSGTCGCADAIYTYANSVTEIIGGSIERSEEDLPSRYLTFCDPRCSVEQVCQ